MARVDVIWMAHLTLRKDSLQRPTGHRFACDASPANAGSSEEGFIALTRELQAWRAKGFVEGQAHLSVCGDHERAQLITSSVNSASIGATVTGPKVIVRSDGDLAVRARLQWRMVAGSSAQAVLAESCGTDVSLPGCALHDVENLALAVHVAALCGVEPETSIRSLASQWVTAKPHGRLGWRWLSGTSAQPRVQRGDHRGEECKAMAETGRREAEEANSETLAGSVVVGQDVSDRILLLDDSYNSNPTGALAALASAAAVHDALLPHGKAMEAAGGCRGGVPSFEKDAQRTRGVPQSEGRCASAAPGNGERNGMTAGKTDVSSRGLGVPDEAMPLPALIAVANACKRERKLVLVLGDMLELGPASDAMHDLVLSRALVSGWGAGGVQGGMRSSGAGTAGSPPVGAPSASCLMFLGGAGFTSALGRVAARSGMSFRMSQCQLVEDVISGGLGGSRAEEAEEVAEPRGQHSAPVVSPVGQGLGTREVAVAWGEGCVAVGCEDAGWVCEVVGGAVQRGDVVLVKGSRGMRMERACLQIQQMHG